MTSGIKCDECGNFFPTEVLKGGFMELQDYVQINFMAGKTHIKPPEHYCHGCWLNIMNNGSIRGWMNKMK